MCSLYSKKYPTQVSKLKRLIKQKGRQKARNKACQVDEKKIEVTAKITTSLNISCSSFHFNVNFLIDNYKYFFHKNILDFKMFKLPSQMSILFIIYLLNLSTVTLAQDSSSESSSTTPSTTTYRSRFARLLDFKDRVVDRLCDSASSVFTSALKSSCTSESYCPTLKTISENLPVGCGILNDGLNDTLRRLAYCVRVRNRTCVEGLMEDLKEKYEQTKTIGEMATGNRK